MSRNNSRLVHLLLLALLVMPGQSLYAQTKMQTSTQAEKCQHETMHAMDAGHQAMSCCDQDKEHCDQNCRDCYQCQTLNAVNIVLDLGFEPVYSRYYIYPHSLFSGLPPATQYRPPRIHV